MSRGKIYGALEFGLFNECSPILTEDTSVTGQLQDRITLLDMADQNSINPQSSDRWHRRFGRVLCRCGAQLAAALAFYTCLPIPPQWQLEFQGIARFAPLIGLVIGGMLTLLDGGLQLVGMPALTRIVLLVAIWIGITGGLHLDGVMDTADGLAVTDPQRRLEVMTDSRTGAFGVMAAIVVLLLKVGALYDLTSDRPFALLVTAAWGRWGQLAAIALYPYLKPTGKGAFHKASIRSPWEMLPSWLLLVGLSALATLAGIPWTMAGGSILGGMGIALVTGAWFHSKLGGHTGDTYGAVVEWTEALLLSALTLAR